MNERSSLDELLEVLARIFLRCTVIGFAMVIFWAGLIIFAKDLTYTTQTWFFDISIEQFDIIHYCGIGLVKVLTFWMFAIPFIAIKLLQRARRRA